MAEDTPQEDKTEEPTARRLEKAREDGQVLRSQDLTTAVVTIGFIATLIIAVLMAYILTLWVSVAVAAFYILVLAIIFFRNNR